MPENLRVHWLWPSKYKRKWCYRPKCVFSEINHHTALICAPLQSACLKTAGCAEFDPPNTKKWCYCQNAFSQKWIIQIWPSKYKGKWSYSPKCVFSEMDHHTALKLVPLGLACLKTSGCTEFDPLNTKESDVLPKMCFLKNSSSYSFETCTTVISMPENCRVQWVLPSKYKGKWHYSPKCVFSKMDHHTALKLVPLGSACLKSSGCTALDPLNTKESDVLPKMWFLRNGSSYSFDTCTTAISMPENLRVHWLWPYKYKGKWSYSPKCIFSKKDNTDLKLVPLGLACLKTSGCTDFDPLNTKKRDVIDQNVFSQKWIIIQLWYWHHCNHHAWKPQGVLSLTLQIQKKVMLLPKMCFLRNG